MDWHPVISVQQQTPDNDFCHFSISNVRFALWTFFRKPEKLGSHTGSKWWPGAPDVQDDPNDPLTRWPNDPVPCLMSAQCTRDSGNEQASVPLQVHAGGAAADWLVTDGSAAGPEPDPATIWTHVQQDLQEIHAQSLYSYASHESRFLAQSKWRT